MRIAIVEIYLKFTNEDTPITVNVLLNDSDVDGDVLTITSVNFTSGIASFN